MIDDERIYLPTAPSNQVPHVVGYAHALPLVKNKTVTDLCCGTGFGTRLLSEAAKSVEGIDYSKEAIEYNKKRVLPNTTFKLGDVEKVKVIKSDVITCMQGLEHLDNPKALIERFKSKTWIVALPHDRVANNPQHHHMINDELIREWFGESVQVWYFDDWGNYSSSPMESFTNFFCVYNG